MSISGSSEKENLNALHEKLHEAELSRLNGERTYSIDEVRVLLKRRYERG